MTDLGGKLRQAVDVDQVQAPIERNGDYYNNLIFATSIQCHNHWH